MERVRLRRRAGRESIRCEGGKCSFVGAIFTQVVKGVSYQATVVSYTPPQTEVQDLAEVETKGLYKVLYDDGDFAQLYYEDLLRHGAKLAPSDETGSEL